MKMETLREFFVHELKDVYDAEHQLAETLNTMRAQATDLALRQAFELHHTETLGHIHCLEEVFNRMDEFPERRTCQAMRGLIKEAQEMMMHDMSDDVMNAALICTAQKCEHYEIASYGCLATYSELLGNTEVTQLLRENLSEEERADAALTQCARNVNKAALA